jgi:hypothetical protein
MASATATLAPAASPTAALTLANVLYEKKDAINGCRGWSAKVAPCSSFYRAR